MKKIMFKDYRGDEFLDGFSENVRWKLTRYYGGPKKAGECFVSNGDGHIKIMYCTGDTRDAKKLFDGIMERHYENVRFSNGRPLTDSDLLELYHKYNVWYDVTDAHEYDDHYQNLIIMTDEDRPKYFMESGIKGPIDSEIDTYNSIYFEFGDDLNKMLEE